MVVKLDIRIDSAGPQSPVILQSRDNEAHPLRLRIGDPSSPGSRYANLSRTQARQLA